MEFLDFNCLDYNSLRCDNDLELGFDDLSLMPSFIKDFNLIVNGTIFTGKRISLRREIDSVEEIIKLLGL